MSQAFTLSAQTRTDLGKRANRRLRRLQDLIPAVIYGGESTPETLQLEHSKVIRALENQAIYSHIITVEINGKPQKAVLKALHRHPYKPRILHMDFLRITGKEKITMHVPLRFINEDIAPGVKVQGGLVNHLSIDAEVHCLPDKLPEYIEVDLSKLNTEESIHLSELKLPEGVEFVALAHGNDLPVVSIHMPRAALEEETKSAAEGTSATTAAPPAEGEDKGA